ncbi:ABC transporter permease [Candidatus Bathyarchaeota archaeon]|nr:MAG: ABC transporter permease [Candidatus Bathyarchaeota archaeon]
MKAVKERLLPVAVKLFTKLLAILLGLGISAVVFAAYGVDPLYAYSLMVTKSLSFRGASEVLTKLIPLQLCGIGLIVAFKSGMWNIGAEGQMLLGATFATWIALFLDVPEFSRLPLIFLFGLAAGAGWALIPALLKVKFEVNEVITTLMMNYIASSLVNYLVYGPWKGAKEWGFPYTDKFPKSVWLPTIAGTRIHWPTLLIAILTAFLVYFLLVKTTVGFEIRVSGQSKRAAEYAGINYGRALLISMAISGALAGLAGVGEVCGIHHRLRYASSISSGYGYAGIIVAWLSELNAVASVLSALFMAFLFAGGDLMQVSLGLPIGVVDVFNGSILISLLVSEAFGRYRPKWRLRLK